MKFSIHIDVDSPEVLANFYNKKLNNYTKSDLEEFYEVTFERMFKLFDEFNIKVTFFIVTKELENSEKISNILNKAIEKGHFIANHTYSHPFGLNELKDEEILNEITISNKIIYEKLKVFPSGFRSPGYAIDTNVINILEKNNILYDSSSGWPLFHIIFKFLKFIGYNKMKVGYGETNSFLRKKEYIPSSINWKFKSKLRRKLTEFPLPSSFFLIPCYSNLHLSLPLKVLNILIYFTKRHKKLIYLMHAIEFASFEDKFIPREIEIHPQVLKTNFEKQSKIKYILNQLFKKRTYFNIENQ